MNDHASLLCHVNLANGFRGGERQTLLLVKALAERGVNQKLIVRKDSELSKRTQSIRGIDVMETNIFAFGAFSEPTQKTFFHFHDSRSFPMFYLNGLFKSFSYIYTRRVQRAPKVNLMSKKIYRDAKKIVCLSSSIRKTVKESFEESIDSIIIPSSCAGFDHDPEMSLKIRQEIKQRFIVGHIGALDDSHKGQLDIIKLARETKKKELDIGFLLVGSGRDELLLKKESKDLDNVYFIGQVENIGDYLKAFDIFIFPSRHEGLGSILLDALEFGIPIIATKVGGIPEIINDGENGIIINDDKVSFLDALYSLYLNGNLRTEISMNNKRKARSFTIEKMVESYMKLYKPFLSP